ncbi:hypothetical protein [Tenacibaculum ovolyticum]|uniref:hypothetical protein n=1 Tax=Tenacibaculum ovolyticum TaxID=104270 RepID=UPI0007ED414A|nr:hypothetical protein [Tenacibaculum ovolyticum]
MDYKKLTTIKEDLENDFFNTKNKVQELEDIIKKHPAKFEFKGDLNEQRDKIIDDINSVDKKITSLKEDNIFLLENLKNRNISNDRVLIFLKKENTIQRNPIKKFFRIPKNPKKLSKKDIAVLIKRLDEIYVSLIQKNEIKKDVLINQSFFINHSINLQKQKNKLKEINLDINSTNNKLGAKQSQIKSVLDSIIDLDFEKAKEKIKDSKVSFKDVLLFIKQLIYGREIEIVVAPLYKEKLKDLEKNIKTTSEVKIEKKLKNNFIKNINKLKIGNQITEFESGIKSIVLDFNKNDNFIKHITESGMIINTDTEHVKYMLENGDIQIQSIPEFKLEIDKRIEENKESIKSVTGTEYEHNTYRLHKDIEALEALKIKTTSEVNIKEKLENNSINKLELGISNEQQKAFNEYFEYGINSVENNLNEKQLNLIPDIIEGHVLSQSDKYKLVADSLEKVGVSYFIKDNLLKKNELDKTLNLNESIVTDFKFKERVNIDLNNNLISENRVVSRENEKLAISLYKDEEIEKQQQKEQGNVIV